MNDIKTLVSTQRVSDELLLMADGVRLKQEFARHLQISLGEGLISTLWDMGGCGTVQLHFNERKDYPLRSTAFLLKAKVGAARDINQRVAVAHFEYFPADWWCAYCGSLLDGLKHPRKCPQCAAPRVRDAKEELGI